MATLDERAASLAAAIEEYVSGDDTAEDKETALFKFLPTYAAEELEEYLADGLHDHDPE